MDGGYGTPHGIQYLDVIPTVQCQILPAMVTGKLPVIRLDRCGPQVKLLVSKAILMGRLELVSEIRKIFLLPPSLPPSAFVAKMVAL